MANDRWPFCFDLDDIEVSGCLLPTQEDTKKNARSPRSEGPQKVNSQRVPGVWVTHLPTGKEIVSTMMPTRDENLAIALRRLDRMVRATL